jgi:hypothetical protein
MAYRQIILKIKYYDIVQNETLNQTDNTSHLICDVYCDLRSECRGSSSQ